MFFSTSDFARPPPLLSPTSSPLIFDVPSPPISKDALQQSQDSSGSSEEEEEEEVDAPPWLLEGGAVKLVRRRKKSPNRGGLNDLAKFWAVQLGDSKREKERRNAKRTPTGEHTELEIGALPFPTIATPPKMATSSQTKDGHPPERFDKILYSDLSDESEWIRLGKGSFGSVYKGEYLGIDVAIKEVMNSTDYDVEKYLMREISLMQQSRHPNILLYLGLCLAPPPPEESLTDNGTSRSTRILIISEYVPRGNLRQYILDRSLPFPWRLRMSFSIDVARALSYLHASPRNCMHRDLKGENLLVTENERIKICDFGLARVVDEVSGSAEMQRSRPLTYCGTDGYMSPEILLGEPFTLSTDVFSLGVLFVEIASRTLTSQHHFVRSPPDYGLDLAEVRSSVSSSCPKAFIDLALRCCDTYPERRPVMKEILAELREIERQVLAREDGGEGDAHSRGGANSGSMKGNVGSISYAGTMKRGTKQGGGGGRPRPSAPRLPSFEGKVKISSSFLAGTADLSAKKLGHPASREGSESEDDGEALLALAEADVPIDEKDDSASEYSTSVLKPRSTIISRPGIGGGGQNRPYGALGSESGSTLPGDVGANQHDRSASLPSLPPSWIAAHSSSETLSQDRLLDPEADEDEGAPTIIARSSPSDSPNKLSYLTARTSTLSIANAVVVHKVEPSDADEEDEARDVFHSTFQHPPHILTTPAPIEALHRFSLIKPGLQRFLGSFAPYSTSSLALAGSSSASSSSTSKEEKRSSWDAAGRLESGGAPSGVGTGRCSLCTKKLGMMKAYLACDDCGYACHIKCSDSVAPTCPASQSQAASLANTPLASPTFPPKPSRAAPSPYQSRTASKDRTSSKLIKKTKTGSIDNGRKGGIPI